MNIDYGHFTLKEGGGYVILLAVKKREFPEKLMIAASFILSCLAWIFVFLPAVGIACAAASITLIIIYIRNHDGNRLLVAAFVIALLYIGTIIVYAVFYFSYGYIIENADRLLGTGR